MAPLFEVETTAIGASYKTIFALVDWLAECSGGLVEELSVILGAHTAMRSGFATKGARCM